MIDSIFQFFDGLTWIGWTAIVIGTLVLGVLVTPDEKVIGADGLPVEEDDYPANGEDTITCTVPGQKPIILRPDEFHTYDEMYTGVWGVTLRNGNSILLPMEYTTIVDNSMELTTL